VPFCLAFSFPLSLSASVAFKPNALDDRAISQTIDATATMCWLREQSGKAESLFEVIPEIWKFRHPFNFDGEAQLNTHVNFLARIAGSDGGLRQLNATPFYAQWEALASIYHCCLAQLLMSSGYALQFPSSGIRGWELAGVEPDLKKLFTSRSSEWVPPMVPGMTQADLSRLKRKELNNQRHMMSKLPPLSLITRREIWRGKIGVRRCEPARREPLYAEPFRIGDISRLFRDHDALTRLELLGALLREHVRGGFVYEEVAGALASGLEAGCGDGVLGNFANRFYCHYGQLERKRAIWEFVRDGKERGEPCVVSATVNGAAWKEFPKLREAAESKDLVRLVSVKSFPIADANDQGLVSVKDFSVSAGAELVWDAQGWSTERFAGYLERAGIDRKLIVVLPHSRSRQILAKQMLRLGPVYAEDLVETKTLKSGQKSIEVIEGRALGGSEVFLDTLRKNSEFRCCVLASPGWPERDFGELSQLLIRHQAETLGLSERVNLPVDEILPWPSSPEAMANHVGNHLVILSTCGFSHHGYRWLVAEVKGDEILLRRPKCKKIYRMDELAKAASSMRLVAERIIDFPIGLTCVATENFSKASGTLKKGYFVIPRSVEADGSVRMDNGDLLTPGFRFFSPLPLVREVPAAPCDCMLAEVKPGDPLLSEVLASKSRRRWILFSTEPDVIRTELAGPIAIQINRKREEPGNDFGPGSPAPGDYEMPPLSFWLEGLERWRRAKKIALIKEPKKTKLKMESPDQRKTPEMQELGKGEASDGQITITISVPTSPSNVVGSEEREPVETEAGGIPSSSEPERRDSSPQQSSKDQEVANKDAIGQTLLKPTTPPAKRKPKNKPLIRKKDRSKDVPGDMNI